MDGRTDNHDSRDLAESYIADIMRREAEIAAMPEPAVRTRSRARQLVLLAGLLIGVCAVDAAILLRLSRPFSEADHVASSHYVMYFTSRAVEAYRSSRRQLPRDLGAIGLANNGTTYVPAGETYVLSMRGPDGPIEFRSDADSSPFTTIWNRVGQGRPQ
jgi:hypothetical protein